MCYIVLENWNHSTKFIKFVLYSTHLNAQEKIFLSHRDLFAVHKIV